MIQQDEGFEYNDPLYRENILDHFRNPRNYGKLANADASYEGNNPLCGDEVEISIKIHSAKVQDARFIGRGCAISQSAASMLTEKIIGMNLTDVKKLTKEDMLEMLGIGVNPTRLKCAILALKVLEGAIHDHDQRQKKLRGDENGRA